MPPVRVAAVQLEARIADVAENLARCERLADEAGAQGAELIVLPEFFTTGMAFREELADAALPPDGAATDLMAALARRHDATVGGSFICRDADGENRNAFLLVTSDGVVGRHDKDIPTMWENAFYIGGTDDGVIPWAPRWCRRWPGRSERRSSTPPTAVRSRARRCVPDGRGRTRSR